MNLCLVSRRGECPGEERNEPRHSQDPIPGPEQNWIHGYKPGPEPVPKANLDTWIQTRTRSGPKQTWIHGLKTRTRDRVLSKPGFMDLNSGMNTNQAERLGYQHFSISEYLST